MAIEIVSFPINSMVIFHSYVNVYQRVTIPYANHGAGIFTYICPNIKSPSFVAKSTSTIEHMGGYGLVGG